MEPRSILCSAITIYSGLFYLNNDLNSNSSIFFFLVIIIGNIYFLYYWAYKTVWGILKIVANKWPCFTKRFAFRQNQPVYANNENKSMSEYSFDQSYQMNSCNQFNIVDGNMKNWILAITNSVNYSEIDPSGLSLGSIFSLKTQSQPQKIVNPD